MPRNPKQPRQGKPRGRKTKRATLTTSNVPYLSAGNPGYRVEIPIRVLFNFNTTNPLSTPMGSSFFSTARFTSLAGVFTEVRFVDVRIRIEQMNASQNVTYAFVPAHLPAMIGTADSSIASGSLNQAYLATLPGATMVSQGNGSIPVSKYKLHTLGRFNTGRVLAETPTLCTVVATSGQAVYVIACLTCVFSSLSYA